MKVYLFKDVEKVGMSGTIINVSDGFAQNFLIPRKLAIRITDKNAKFYEDKVKKTKLDSKVLSSKIAMVAERIKNMHLTLKKKTHDGGKLYGAVSADDIVELLKQKDVVVNKKQVEFAKSIKTTGEHKVTVRLSSKLKPNFVLKVVESK